ncbi:MAG: hypothetical protein OXC46_07935 [Thaumarchaeota archaeon]|nr:hypothetical protein [Nitrososphaerota archaeon]
MWGTEGMDISVLVSMARTCNKVGIFPRIAVENITKNPKWRIFETIKTTQKEYGRINHHNAENLLEIHVWRPEQIPIKHASIVPDLECQCITNPHTLKVLNLANPSSIIFLHALFCTF